MASDISKQEAPDPGRRQLFVLDHCKGIWGHGQHATTDPAYLARVGWGFVVNTGGKLQTEPLWFPVPVNEDGTLGGIIPSKIRIRDAEVGGVAQANIRPYFGRMVYLVADVPADGWATPPPGGVSGPTTVVLKGAYTLDEVNNSTFPPRRGIEWRLAHEWHPTYGPPWGKNQALVNDLDLVLYNGGMYFCSYDGIQDHPDPSIYFKKGDSSSGRAKKGGIYVDFREGSGSTPDGPADVTSVMRYETPTEPKTGAKRLTDGKVFYCNTAGVHANTLFASSSYIPGQQVLRFANPGQAHIGGSGGGWPTNQFLQIGQYENHNILAMLSTPDALYIFAENSGIYGLYGSSPDEWRLFKISDLDCVGHRSLWRMISNNDLVFLDAKNRLWKGQMAKFKWIDQVINDARDISDARGGLTAPILEVGDWIMRSGSQRTTTLLWKREASHDPNLAPLYSFLRVKPLYINQWLGAITASRYNWSHATDSDVCAAFDPSVNRSYFFGGKVKRTEAEGEYNLWYTDWARLPLSFIRKKNQFIRQVGTFDFCVFVPWFFGTHFDYKRIHSIFVAARPTPESPQSTMRWYIRYLTRQGWSAPAAEDDSPPSAAGWHQMAMIDFDMDSSQWVPNYEIPVDGESHRIAIQEPDGAGDFGRGVIAIQLGFEYDGTETGSGMILQEVAVEYEVYRLWP